MDYKKFIKDNQRKLYICSYQKASKLIKLLKLDKYVDKNDVFSVDFLNITVILYKEKSNK